ncbi:MAG: rubrerythrin family protein [Aigarchaeota archaeon]|nr:rubrerythrin family protein [Aigarchaeota archaeon]MDW7985955.1 rubrerythrin family protein [Nitrososphaerota archaeon]
MKVMTKENIKNAFSGESQAHMKYMIFSKKAEEEGYPNIAKLFRAIAYAELVHAANHLNVIGMIRTTSDNIRTALEGESYEVEEMYPAYNTVAKLQAEKQAELSTYWALEAEKEHITLYKKALKSVEERKDLEITSIYVCEKCGYTIEGELPDKCPICGASKEKFKKF